MTKTLREKGESGGHRTIGMAELQRMNFGIFGSFYLTLRDRQERL